MNPSSNDPTTTPGAAPPGTGADRRTPRVVRAGMPKVRSVLAAAATEYGVCLRLVALRVTDTVTGTSRVVDVPCGATRAAVCPPCAERARTLRAAQCREGWHLAEEPEPARPVPTERQRELATEAADLRYIRELTAQAGHDPTELDPIIAANAAELVAEGVRGTLPAWPDPDSGHGGDEEAEEGDQDEGGPGGRRVRSTRRREDVPDLPRLPVANYTIGRTYGQGGRFRPSLFATLTLPSYGPVGGDGAPTDPDTYDYRRAARDAIHFGKLTDRLVQNLRRAVGWNVQYFAAVEPQRRGAPHLHAAIRGTIPRAVLRQVAAATYHQVWWPPCDTDAYDPARPGTWPRWAPEVGEAGGYVDPATGEVLPTWTQALDMAEEQQAGPAHVVRFGAQVNAQGVLGGKPQAGRLIGYLTKYLTKNIGDCHTPATEAARAHVARLVEALRYEPCAPTCPNWLLHHVQPKNAREGMRPGGCKGAAHRPANLGYGGRRVLVSRWWSAKTLTDHRADRRAFAFAILAEQQAEQPAASADRVSADGGGTDPNVKADATTDTGREAGQLRWEYARPGDPDIPPLAIRVSRALAERVRWRRCLTAARDHPPDRQVGREHVFGGVGASGGADGQHGKDDGHA